MEMNHTAREVLPLSPSSSGVLPETSTTSDNPTSQQHPEPCDWLLYKWMRPAFRFAFGGRVLSVMGETAMPGGVVVSVVKITDEHGHDVGAGVIPSDMLADIKPSHIIQEKNDD